MTSEVIASLCIRSSFSPAFFNVCLRADRAHGLTVGPVVVVPVPVPRIEVKVVWPTHKVERGQPVVAVLPGVAEHRAVTVAGGRQENILVGIAVLLARHTQIFSFDTRVQLDEINYSFFENELF